MTAVIAIALVGGLLYMIFVYARSMAQHAKFYRDSARFERELRAWREAASRETSHRAATAADAELVARLAATVSYEAELAAAGFTRIGDSIGSGTSLTRAFADATRTTVVALSVMPKRPVLVSLWSFVDGGAVVTGGDEQRRLAEPTWIRRQVVPGAPLGDLVARHLATCASLAPLAIATNDELVARVNEVHRGVVAWRRAQSPDDLLDADLRIALGAQYAKRGATWRRKLRGELPEARLVR